MSGVTTTGGKLQYCTQIGRACHYTIFVSEVLQGNQVVKTMRCQCGHEQSNSRNATQREVGAGRVIPGSRPPANPVEIGADTPPKKKGFSLF